jgi:hypothetical protein
VFLSLKHSVNVNKYECERDSRAETNVLNNSGVVLGV